MNVIATTALLSALLLSACANTTPTPIKVTPTQRPEESAAPNRELSAGLLYGILVSELAVQRGGALAAAPAYLELAKETADPRLARRAAELALSSGNLNVADEALALWEQQMPDSVLAKQQRVMVLWREGRIAEAEQRMATQLQGADISRAASLFMHVTPLLPRQADPQAAAAAIERLSQIFPRLPEAHFAQAVAAATLKEDAAVERSLDTLADLAPRWDLPVLWRLDAVRKQSPDLALAFLEKELKRRPHAGAELQLARPRLLVGLRQYEAAREGFAAVLKQFPHHPDARYALGILAFQLKQYDEADQHLRAALEAGYVDAPFVRLTLGQLAEERKQLEEAKTWYQAIGKGRHYNQAQARLAAIEVKEGKLEAALTRIEGLENDVADPIELLLLQSQLAREAGANAKAYQLLSRGIKQFPAAATLYYERALLADRLNRSHDAERDLRRFLRMKPNDAQGMNALGYTLANRGQRLAEARRLIEAALQQQPTNPMILDSMGWVLFRQGKLKDALSYLEQAYEQMKDAEIAAHLGEVLWRLGQRDAARQIWEEAKQRDPEHKVLQETLRRLKP